jgi:hypothetical protein
MNTNRPIAPLIGANGNIFNLMAIAKRTLQSIGQDEQAERMISEVHQCKSYYEALNVIEKYVEFGEAGEDED